MISPSLASVLADPTLCSATLCQRSLRLLADYDFSRPRLLSPSLLDQRYSWPAGTCQRILDELSSPRLQLLHPLSVRPARSRYPERVVVQLAREWTTTHQQQEQYQHELADSQARAAVVLGQTAR